MEKIERIIAKTIAETEKCFIDESINDKKEYTGTYTYKSGRKESSVALTFSDGTKGNGTCAQYMFDGVWYEGTLQVFGKEYYFAGYKIQEV